MSDGMRIGDGPYLPGNGGWQRSMDCDASSLRNWTPDEVALGRRWVEAWREAGREMERLRRQELRSLDARRAIALLCGPADYRVPPRAPRPSSGLVEQQHWFKRAAGRD